MNRRNIISRFA